MRHCGGPRSIRIRLAFWHAAGLAAILTVVGAAAVGLHSRMLEADVDDDLRLIAVGIADLAEVGASPDGLSAALAGLEEPALVSPFYRITPAAGPVIEAGAWPHGLHLAPVRGPVRGPVPAGLRTERFPGGRARILAQGLTTPAGEALVLEVGTSLDKLEASRADLVGVLLLVGPVGVALAWLGGYWLAGRALAPIAVITERARTLSIGRLGTDRLPIANPEDELGRLAVTINAMLDRLARAVDEIRRFSADASHELKTPLAILKGELGLAARGERRPEVYRAVLRSALEEVDRMSRVVDRLLRLARAGSGEASYERAPVALDRLVHETAVHLGREAARRAVSLEVDAPAPVVVAGDDPRLRELIVILLDNAIRYTPAGGRVLVRVASAGTAVMLVVEDTGVGIPAEALPRVFEPFFRADRSRARGAGGSGLGLAIARATVEGHGGTIEIASNAGAGTRVTIRLPAAARHHAAR